MQLSPLQSRLAASLIASCLVIALYFTLFSPHFALADELKAAAPIILDHAELLADLDRREAFDVTYEPDFAAFDRSVIGRAAPDVISLSNNAPNTINVSPGQTQVYVFALSLLSKRGASEGADEHELETRGENNASQEGDVDVGENDAGEHRLEKRATNRTVYITANTCLQPKPSSGNATANIPPQLTLYVSTSSSNQSPGPSQNASTQTSVPFTLGAVMFNMSASSDVYVGIYAPNNTGFSGVYNAEVAASVDTWYHSYDAKIDAGLIWVDSDAHAALLVTKSLTTSNDSKVLEALQKNPPYGMFAQNQADQSINNLLYSYCGLRENSRAVGTDGKVPGALITGITTTGVDQYPKQQFYFSGLNPSSSYIGILVMDGNKTVNGTLNKRGGIGIGAGGHVFKATRFETKQALSSCSIVRGLQFCDKVEYAVPSNYTNFPSAEALGKWYDSSAQAQYALFKNNLAQIPCEAPSDQAYSLVRNCSDCQSAYKDWLCSVMMPRCEDINSTATHPRQPRAVLAPFADGSRLNATALAARNISSIDLGRAAFTSSRNILIDQWVQPGPYQEVLPCADLCWNLVQSCPASMGFACPGMRAYGFNTSYALRATANENGELTCNFPGSAHIIRSAGPGRAVPRSLAALLLAVTVIYCAL